MRPIVCNIIQNLGTGVQGNLKSVSGNVTKIGKVECSIDDKLTKIKAGELTVEVQDPGDLIWTFLQTQLSISTTTGSLANGLLPPFLQFMVGGNQEFLGNVDPSRIVRHIASDQHSIEFGSQDWSTGLASLYLGAPSANPWVPNHEYQVGMQVINNDAVFQCTVAGISASSGGPALGISTTYTDGTVTWQYLPPGWTRPASPNAIPTFDGVHPSSLNYLIVQKASGAKDYSIWLQSVDGIFPQDKLRVVYSASGSSASFTALSTDPELGVVNTLEQVQGLIVGNGVYFDDDTNQELVMSDAVDILKQAAAPFAVDTSRFVKTVLSMPVFGWLPVVNIPQAAWKPNTSYTIGQQVSNSGHIYQCGVAGISSASGGPSGMITTAIADGTIHWFYLPPATTNLVSVSDIEPTLTGIRVISGFSNAYHGGPDIGWTPELPVSLPATQPQYADWTNQLAAAPSSLMPYTNRTGNPSTGSQGDAPWAMLRNRCYQTNNYGQFCDNGPVSWYQAPGWNTAYPYWSASTPSTWYDPFQSAALGSPANFTWFQSNRLAPTVIFYDYLQMRKIVIVTTPGSSAQTITVYPWTGTAWGAGAVTTWPGGHIIMSLCNFPGGPASALLALTTTGTLELGVLGASSLLGATNTILQNGVLVPTPYGPCIVDMTSYGQITYSGGTLACIVATLGWISGNGENGPVTSFWPNTLVARSSSEIVMLGRLDSTSGGATTTESWLYRLTLPPNPSYPQHSIIFSEPISAGAPVFAGAILDPTKPGRVIGHWGGQLWQVDYELPWTIERFTPDGMTALDCIEHICQLNNAIAVPQPSGVMAIISRGIPEAPIALTPLMVKTDQMLCWQNFFSIVRCTTQDGSIYWDAPSQGGNVGGKLLEVDNQPMLWRLSQCAAMAENYAAWFNIPRAQESQTWTYPDADTAPSWEGLPSFARVTVNGSHPWRVMSMSQDYIDGTCDVVLVED